MPLDQALRLVQETADISSISCLGLTGGEPLLFWDEIQEVMRQAASIHLPFTIATAAHWAADPREARARIDFMLAQGLSRANISCDPSHEEWVSRETVQRAASLLAENGVETHIVGTFKDVSIASSYFESFPKLEALQIHPRIVAKVGMATKWSLTALDEEFTLDELTCYRRVHHDLVVFWDGKAYPCCSTFNRATPGIVVGNAFQEPLKDIWMRVEGSLKFRTIKRRGFGALYKIIQDRAPELHARLPTAKGCRGACSLCNSIFRDASLAQGIDTVMQDYEVDQFVGIMEHVERVHGPATVEAIVNELERKSRHGQLNG